MNQWQQQMQNSGIDFTIFRPKFQVVPEDEPILKRTHLTYVYRHALNGTDYIVKRIKKVKVNAKKQKDFCQRLMGRPYIVKVLDVWENQSFLYILMNYYPMNLRQFILNQWELIETKHHIPFKLFLQLLFALTEIKVMHRDIKPANCLINVQGEQEYSLYLSDFGECSKGQLFLQSFVGTPLYQAPQVRKNSVSMYSRKADVWSLGIVLYQLFCGRNNSKRLKMNDLQFPYIQGILGTQASSSSAINEYYNHGIYQGLILKTSIPQLIRKLIRSMLQPEPSERFSYLEIYKEILDGHQNVAEIIGSHHSKTWLEKIEKYHEIERINEVFYSQQEYTVCAIRGLYWGFYHRIKRVDLDECYHKLMMLIYYGINQLNKEICLLQNQFSFHEDVLSQIINPKEKLALETLEMDLLIKLGFLYSKQELKKNRNQQTLKEYCQLQTIKNILEELLHQEEIIEMYKVYDVYLIQKLN